MNEIQGLNPNTLQNALYLTGFVGALVGATIFPRMWKDYKEYVQLRRELKRESEQINPQRALGISLYEKLNGYKNKLESNIFAYKQKHDLESTLKDIEEYHRLFGMSI